MTWYMTWANSHSHMKARHHLYKFQILLYPCALVMQTSPLAIVVSLGWMTVTHLSLIFDFFKMSAIPPEFGPLFWNLAALLVILTSALSRYDKCFFSLCDISLVDEIKVMLISSCLLWTSCWLQWIASPGCSCFAGLFVSIRNTIFVVTREARVKGKLGEEKMGGRGGWCNWCSSEENTSASHFGESRTHTILPQNTPAATEQILNNLRDHFLGSLVEKRDGRQPGLDS